MFLRKIDPFKKCLFGFQILYLLYLLCAFCAFLNGNPIFTVSTYLVAALGILLCIWALFFFRQLQKAPHFWILVAFLLSYVLSAGFHISYSISENVKGFIWLTLPILLVYVPCQLLTVSEMRQQCGILFRLYTLWVTLSSLVSLSMIYWGRWFYFTDFQGEEHVVGYHWDRLWGVYDDPNYGAVITLLAVFYLFYRLWQTKSRCKKIGYGILLVINYLYIILSDSRTGMVSFLGSILVGGLFTIWAHYRKEKKKVALKIASLFLAGLVIVGASYALEEIYQPFDEQIAKMAEQHFSRSKKDSEKARKKALQKDVSNGRLTIWANALELFQSSPVWGIGYRNIVPYTEDTLPDLYLVNASDDIQYDSMHNLELDVLVSQGILGEGLFLLLLFSCMRTLFQSRQRMEKERTGFSIFAFTCVVGLGIGATFLSYIFYVNSPQNFCFWLCLGYLMCLCKKSEAEAPTEEGREYRAEAIAAHAEIGKRAENSV